MLDRTDLILDIFAQRARSREGRLQVEVAQLARLLPRLIGKGGTLRLGGGIGTRGPGETKLEADRRRVRDRLTALRERNSRARATPRALPAPTLARPRFPSLRLWGTPMPASRRFSTPSPAAASWSKTGSSRPSTRQPGASRYPGAAPLCSPILSASSGTYRPELTAAFTATLGELHEADLLLHVTDVSHPAHEEQRETVLAFLRELDLAHIPRLEVYSKIDRLPPGDLLRTGPASESAVAVSAATGERLGESAGASGGAALVRWRARVLVPYQRLGALTRSARRGPGPRRGGAARGVAGAHSLR